MKALLNVNFLVPGGLEGNARLEIDLPFTPEIEIGFEHPVWDEARKPISVSYNLRTERFYVEFPPEELPSAEERERVAGLYHGHGWMVTMP